MTISKFWMPLTFLLITITAISGIVACSRYSARRSAEISISSPPIQEQLSEIYIGGAVTNPGFYPLQAGDGIEALIQAAGGTITSADLNVIKLYISELESEQPPQKINLNRAEAWLLEALPGIGEERAKATIDYRYENGPFHNIHELIKVDGIGPKTYEQVKHLITVAN